MSDLAVSSFVARGEAILIGFLQGFFQQEALFNNIVNEFRWVDNVQQDSLIIGISESFFDDSINACPAIVLQEGGWSEILQSTGGNLNWFELENAEGHITPFFHPYTLHCVAATKSSSKLLQSAAGKAIIGFRKALYSMGIDNISPLQGGPPVRLSAPDETIPGYYDSTVTFTMKMEQQWLSTRSGDPIESVRFAIIAALSEITFDENGVPEQPMSEWILQNIHLDW